jgi:hypothetical protein
MSGRRTYGGGGFLTIAAVNIAPKVAVLARIHVPRSGLRRPAGARDRGPGSTTTTGTASIPASARTARSTTSSRCRAGSRHDRKTTACETSRPPRRRLHGAVLAGVKSKPPSGRGQSGHRLPAAPASSDPQRKEDQQTKSRRVRVSAASGDSPAPTELGQPTQ